MPRLRSSSALALVVGLTLFLATPSWAAMQAGKAAVARVTGRVEVLNPGQSQWAPLAQGAQLSEGAQVRCYSGASAELTLPDQTTVLVAENTRYALTRLQVDPQTGARNIFSNLIVGKVAAKVRRAGVELVRARQSNFAIATPSGVAAVRGTEVVLAYDPATNTGILFVLPSPGEPAALATATYFDFNTGTSRLVAGGSFVTHVAGQLPSQPASISTLPLNVQQQVTAATNAGTAGSSALTAATVVIVPPGTIQQALVALGAPPGPPPGPPPGTAGTPSTTTPTTGRDVTTTAQTCASPPCPTP